MHTTNPTSTMTVKEMSAKCRPLLLEYTSEIAERARQEELYSPPSRTLQWCLAPLIFVATMASSSTTISFRFPTGQCIVDERRGRLLVVLDMMIYGSNFTDIPSSHCWEGNRRQRIKHVSNQQLRNKLRVFFLLLRSTLSESKKRGHHIYQGGDDRLVAFVALCLFLCVSVRELGPRPDLGQTRDRAGERVGRSALTKEE